MIPVFRRAARARERNLVASGDGTRCGTTVGSSFRHSLATAMVKLRVDPKTVEVILRHEDFGTTMEMYAQSDMEFHVGCPRETPRTTQIKGSLNTRGFVRRNIRVIILRRIGNPFR
jgi:integrase